MAIISVSKKEDLGSCFQFFRGPQIGKRTTEYSIYVFKGLTNGWKTTKSISAQTERKIFFFFFLLSVRQGLPKGGWGYEFFVGRDTLSWKSMIKENSEQVRFWHYVAWGISFNLEPMSLRNF